MNIYAVVLIVTGAILIAVSLFNLRHPQSSDRFTHVHSQLNNERIAEQLKKRPSQGVAGLGVAAGIVFIGGGLIWMLI